jgi:tetratricopeptide (TPR) repeat protein
MRSRWALLFVLMHIAGFSGAATAQAQPVIERSGSELAEFFYNRGNVYYGKGQPDRAIQDYDQAIRLNPNFAEAFRARGLAKQAKGDIPGSNADIAKARQLNPSLGN